LIALYVTFALNLLDALKETFLFSPLAFDLIVLFKE
jgi:hypothetical protein